jgi:hypothetical protein
VIILEGPDGSGKTTLAGRIVEEFGMEYRRPPEALLSSTHGPAPDLVDWWRNELRRPGDERKAGVYDRTFWISEPIYQAVSARQPMCTTEEVWRGIADLWAEDPILIFCMTDEAGMIENAYAAGRPRLASIDDDSQKLRAVNFLYWSAYAIWQQASNRVYQYDYNRDHWSFIYNAISENT